MGSGARLHLNDEARMPNDEGMREMSKPEGMTKSEAQSAREYPFVIRASSPFVIRHYSHHSSFGFRHFPHPSLCSG
jgi:hypothetical protein